MIPTAPELTDQELTDQERAFAELENVLDLLRVGVAPENFDRRIREFFRRHPPALADLRRAAGVRPVAVRGSAAYGLQLGYFEARLRDGSTGYFQRRTDDCMQAAL